MTLTLSDLLLISALVFVVAALYSSVGHGGASGYLAILTFFSIAPRLMSSTALILNVLVSGISLYMFWRCGHLRPKMLIPFVIGSVPAAFVGGMLAVPYHVYTLLLGISLTAAAIRLSFQFGEPAPSQGAGRQPGIFMSSLVGGAIGLLSGIVGIGGGIFLGPVLVLARWASPKESAGICAGFILVNSLSGLAGRSLSGTLEVGTLAPFLAAAFVGGLLGSWAGARLYSPLLLRRVLAFVLMIAVIKLVVA